METFNSEVQPDIQLRVYGCGGGVAITGHDRTTIDVNGDESLELYLRQEGNTITINGYPSDLQIDLPHRATVELNGIGADVEVRAVGELGARAMAKLSAHGIGGDVRVADVAQIDLESIGGDVEIEHGGESAESNQRVKVGHVGGDFKIRRAAHLSLRVVGGDVEVGHVDRLEGLGHIGGDLELTLGGTLEGDVRTIVGGDAEIHLPATASLTLSATVGGDLNASGDAWNLRRGPGRHRLVFGEGKPQIQLMIGGDLQIRGGSAPQQATGFAGYQGEGSPDWQDFRGTMEGFGEDMRGFGRELEEMGRNLARDLSNLGREIAREVRIAGRETMRDAARGYKAGRRPDHGRGRGSYGDFGFDPEQIERIKREARSAAASGIAKAQEAVEQALQQWQQNKGGGRPMPPRGPYAPPRPEAPQRPFTGQTVRIEREPEEQQPAQPQPSQPVNRDAERLAILRMVHEGRLSPDEAEMLLRGLDNRA